MKKYIFIGILMALVLSAMTVTGQQSGGESAVGDGKLVNEDGSHSQFSFNVRRNPNGKIVGQATLRNPSFRTGNGQNNLIRIDVTCLKVVGNKAFFGGMTKRKNNQAKSEAMYFAVEDGGERGDAIFRGFYFDDDPNTDGDPQRCETLEPEVAVFEPIVSGNVNVRGRQP